MPTAKQILASLDSLRLGGLQACDAEVARVRDLCAAGQIESLVDDIATARVGAMVTALARKASPQFLEVFSGIEFAVLDTCLCNASATNDEQECCVIVHGGLIQAMIFHMELAETCYQMNQLLGGRISPTEGADATGNAISVIAYSASCAMDHFAAAGAPLPRAGQSLSPQSRERLLVAFIRAIWFVVLHEVGHIRLGHHHRLGETTVPSPALAVDELLNEFKSDEFEADQYVAQTLAAEERALAIEYLLSPLDMFSAIELRLRNATDTHPMAVNRLSAMLDHVSNFVDADALKLARENVQRLSDRARADHRPSTERVEQPAAIKAVRALNDLHRRVASGHAAPTEDSYAQLWDDIVGHWFH